jgi:hypothetical protein
MNRLATILFGLALVATPVFATTPDILINGGTMDFDYQEISGGSVSGHFGSSGSLVEAPPGEGTAATTYVLDGLNYLTVVGALEDGSNFIDGGVVVLSSAGPIMPGTYVLDASSNFLVFVDDAVGWVPPADLWNTNWTLELMSIVAAGKYVATAGTVELTEVSSVKIAGTFDAMVIDPMTGIALAVVSGSFNVETPTPVESGSWSSVKSLYR